MKTCVIYFLICLAVRLDAAERVVTSYGGLDLLSEPLESGFPVYDLREKSTNNETSVDISLDRREYRADDKITIEIEFTASQGGHFLNLTLQPGLPMPARLPLYNHRQERVGDFLWFVGGSVFGVGESQVTRLPAECSLKFKKQYSLSNFPRLKKYTEDGKLPPGTYYLQLVFDESLSFLPEYYQHPHPPLLPKELFRSNIASFSIIP